MFSRKAFRYSCNNFKSCVTFYPHSFIKSSDYFSKTLKLCFRVYSKTGARHFINNQKPKNLLSFKSPKTNLVPEVAVPNETSKFNILFKPFCFTAAFTCCCYGGSAIWQYESMRSRAAKLFNEQTSWWLNRPKGGMYRQKFNRLWNSLPDGQKVASGIILLNGMVFAAWKIKSLQPVMLRYFTTSPSSKNVCWPMVLSTFSHYSTLHLFVNMYVLFSFSYGIGKILGKEQFLATYLSAGAIASFVSLAHKVAVGKNAMSLGASGAIMAVLAMVCTELPETQLAIIFLPFITFSAGNALMGILALDSAGLVLGWKLFDHAAHLGGALFGIFYVTNGQKWMWDKREGMMKRWHELREKSNK